jgi:hypothetical protein
MRHFDLASFDHGKWCGEDFDHEMKHFDHGSWRALTA